MQFTIGKSESVLKLNFFQNVIMQMLSVYPDLLGDQAPPPAPPTMVNNLPIKKIEKKGNFVNCNQLVNFVLKITVQKGFLNRDLDIFYVTRRRTDVPNMPVCFRGW